MSGAGFDFCSAYLTWFTLDVTICGEPLKQHRQERHRHIHTSNCWTHPDARILAHLSDDAHTEWCSVRTFDHVHTYCWYIHTTPSADIHTPSAHIHTHWQVALRPLLYDIHTSKRCSCVLYDIHICWMVFMLTAEWHSHLLLNSTDTNHWKTFTHC